MPYTTPALLYLLVQIGLLLVMLLLWHFTGGGV